MFLCMNTGMLVPWRMCGTQRTALGTSSLHSLLEAISSLLFVIKASQLTHSFWALSCLHLQSPHRRAELFQMYATMTSFMWVLGTHTQILTLYPLSPQLSVEPLTSPCHVMLLHSIFIHDFCLFGDRVSLSTDSLCSRGWPWILGSPASTSLYLPSVGISVIITIFWGGTILKYIIYLLLWCWGSHKGPHTCKVSTLPTEL